jgi:F-type H+-transporting ATPase subunit delta
MGFRIAPGPAVFRHFTGTERALEPSCKAGLSMIRLRRSMPRNSSAGEWRRLEQIERGLRRHLNKKSVRGYSQVSSKITGATGLAGRYATALFELADAGKELDQVAADLDAIGAMIDGSEDMNRLIRSPVISRDEQAAAMSAILDAAKIGKLTSNFVGVVARNRRLFALPGMIRGYRALLAAHRGESTAEVVSAVKLSDKQIKAIGESLKKAMGTKVTIEQSVDAGLLGGLIVKVGSRMVDSSLRTKLGKLRLAMKGVG